jgi:metal-sulfur cluster biosynthetic enzyme
MPRVSSVGLCLCAGRVCLRQRNDDAVRSGHHRWCPPTGTHHKDEAMTDTTSTLPTSAAAAAALPSEEQIYELLRRVYDPELGINIVDLGLLYGIQVDDESRRVLVDMTLTTPACPLGPVIRNAANAIITTQFPWVAEVVINLVWSPRWDPVTMASEEAKAELGIW